MRAFYQIFFDDDDDDDDDDDIFSPRATERMTTLAPRDLWGWDMVELLGWSR